MKIANVLKWTALVGAASLGILMAQSRVARSADHLDSPAVRMDPAADINDVYSFMDGNNVVLVMTVAPAATTASKFSDQIQYVFHTSSGAAFGATTSDVNIICTFDAAQAAQCWAGTDAYATGNASQPTGIASADGKMKVFAGLRADPFFFNLNGFNATVDTVKAAAGGLVFDEAGCPDVPPGTSAALRDQLKTVSDGGPPVDFFKDLNTLAIVVAIDKSLVTKGGPVMSVWGSTNRKQ